VGAEGRDSVDANLYQIPGADFGRRLEMYFEVSITPPAGDGWLVHTECRSICFGSLGHIDDREWTVGLLHQDPFGFTHQAVPVRERAFPLDIL
jgi:hypothetical protein